MKNPITIILILLALIKYSTASAELIVLSYHDVVDAKKSELSMEAMSVTNKVLAEQFSWLQANNYHVTNIDELISAQQGKIKLPEKTVLLTFDDGYKGMYEQAFPLLKMFNYPAVLAVMGKWLDTEKGEDVLYGQKKISRENFLTWPQIREMMASGLVEVASHSYDLHHGIIANPQGNIQPAAITHLYDPVSEKYEDDQSYRLRIISDLRQSVQLIEQHLGVKPRVMVWPYGAYNQVTINIAKSLGMPITMSLDEGVVDVKKLNNIHRLLVGNESSIADFVWLISNSLKGNEEPIRVMHVDLDYVYDKNVKQQEKNLDKLLDRIKHMGVNTVYLQAFADPDGDGNTNSLYFPNRHLPMRADLFNRVSWQLRTRAEVNVYAWMPVLAYDLPKNHKLLTHRVKASPKQTKVDYRRLSPFSEEAKKFVGDIYEDLSKYSHFSGLIFHDDAYLSDFEDTSSFALKAYQAVGLGSDIAEIKKDPKKFKQWTRLKTQALAQWTDTLVKRAAVYQSQIKTARNMYAAVIMNPESEAWFAQSLPVFLKHYDYTAVMAMPYMEKASDPEGWLATLVQKVSKTPNALNKTVFELQSVNWRKKTPVPDVVLAKQMHILMQNGARHFGYYPDDFIQDLPSIDIIRPALSLTSEPQG